MKELSSGSERLSGLPKETQPEVTEMELELGRCCSGSDSLKS